MTIHSFLNYLQYDTTTLLTVLAQLLPLLTMQKQLLYGTYCAMILNLVLKYMTCNANTVTLFKQGT